MINSTVSGFSIAAMAVCVVCGFLIPAVLFLCFKKYFGVKKLPFFIGCITFFVTAIVLESVAHVLILGKGRAEVLMAKPLLYALYGGFMAGLFEETGRFLAYKILLKKGGERFAMKETALSYGAGHGGFEAFYILVVSMVGNLVVSIMINTGNTQLILNGMDEARKAAMIQTLNQLVSVKPGLFLVSAIERLGAVAFHIAASIFVWISVTNKKKWFLYPVSIILHAVLDMIAAFFNAKGVPIAIIEILVYLYSGSLIFISWQLLKKENQERT